jgi:hypothetical protein
MPSEPEEKPMTLNEILLQKLAEWRPAARQTLTVAEAGWTVALSADRCDELGCLVWEVTFTRTASSEVATPLRTWAERVADRATGLLENLQLLEVDPLRNQAQLRSDEPAQRGPDVFYYEVLLNGGGDASVRRFRANRISGQRREQVAFALTHEALAKLVADVTA